MADFETSYYITNAIEGGYANDKDDKGGETYRGIARNFNMDWPGWKIIDSMKGQTGFPKCLDSNEELQHLVKKSYKEKEWAGIKGDKIQSQAIANEVYDNAVNMGIPTSIEYLQRTINILNRNQKIYPDIKVDGIMGDKTLEALNICIKSNGTNRVLNVINAYQVSHYLNVMEKNPVNEKYVGWFDRVEIMWN